MSMRSVVALGAVLLLALLVAPSFASAQGGVLYGSGYNDYGELGDGATGYRYGSESIPGVSNVMAVSVSYYDTLALLTNGTVEAWGGNEYGELGDGTKTERKSPVVVPGLSGVTAVAAGEYHSLALLSNHTVEAWGSNEHGQLGNNGANTETATPEVVPGLTNVTAIAAGSETSYALLANGTVEAWGKNKYGEVGDGTKTDRKAPVPLAGLENVVAISAGYDFALALLKNGTVEAWGYGGYGEIGTGSVGEQLSPAPVPGLSGVSAISAGGYFGLALLPNGTVDAWGYNGYGELGDGTETEERPVEQVPGVSNVAEVSGNGYFALVRLTNGTVEGWGYNDDGELGDLSSETRLTHELLPFPGAAIGLASGAYNYHSMVIEGAVGSVSSSSLTFAAQTVGSTSASQSVVLTNNGPAPMSISGDSLSGAGSGVFHKSSDSCQGATVAVGATCTIAYSFVPSAAGGASATLTLAASAAQALPSIALSGTGVAPVAPSLSAITLSASAFRAASSGASALAATASTGTFVIYTDSQAATATFIVEQQLKGLIAGSGRSKRCGKASKHPKKGAKHCTYYKTLGSFTHADTPGTNALRFTGRVAGRALKTGSYRLSASAKSAEGTSAVRTVAFKITH